VSDALVVGLGSVDRGDDAIGPTVAGSVAGLGLAGVRVVVHEDPTALIDLWAGHDLVVVVDAVRSGAPAGSLHRLETGADAPALPRSAWAGSGRGGTHAFGLAAAVELARALRRLPQRLVLVGVEAGRFDHGEPLTAPVARSVGTATARVAAEIEAGAEAVTAGP
jgi:hydrogenase maturation protease